MSHNEHSPWMQRCFDLARMAGKATQRNPLVGAVLVFDNRIIGEGYHAFYGGAHAEINALNSVSPADRHLISCATLYVSLEPCCHTGKTPPCTLRIVNEKIPRVVYGITDPNPVVRGAGIRFLTDNGVDVIGPICPDEALTLIRPFMAAQESRPFVILKWAESADGYIAETGKQTWLSNSFATTLAHKWRGECDGILIGRNTAATDNPSLTTRSYPGASPIRIVLDTNDVLPSSLSLFMDTGTTWIICQEQKKTKSKASHIVVENTRDLATVVAILFQRGIHRLLVEGGTEILRSFITAGLWDEARIIRTPRQLRQGVPSPFLTGRLLEQVNLHDNLVFRIQNNE